MVRIIIGLLMKSSLDIICTIYYKNITEIKTPKADPVIQSKSALGVYFHSLIAYLFSISSISAISSLILPIT